MPEEQEQQPQQEVVTTLPPTPEQKLEMTRMKESIAKEFGLPSPYGMELMKQICRDMVESGLVPQHFARNPMAVYAAALRGKEMGLTIPESIFETFWAAPGGRLGMLAAKMLQIMNKGGVNVKYLTLTEEEAVIEFTPPRREAVTVTFHIREAKRAGLLKPDSNYAKWPEDMCRSRCISRGWRMLLGTFDGGANFYSREELEDSEPAPVNYQKEQEHQEEKQAVAQFSPGRRRHATKKPDTEEARIEEMSPEMALYTAIGCTNQEQFKTYSAATGYHHLDGDEKIAFCLLAAKLVDAKRIIELHHTGKSYAQILDVVVRDVGIIQEATRDQILKVLDNI